MNWPSFLRNEKELLLYRSYKRPTKIRKDGKRPSSMQEAEEVKKDFLKLDSFHNGLFEQVFEDGIDTIDELDSLSVTRFGKGTAFDMTCAGIRVHASVYRHPMPESPEIDVIEISVKGDKYYFSKTPAHTVETFKLQFTSTAAYYNVSGKLHEKDFNDLVKPNSPSGKHCFKNVAGYCGAIIKGEVVPALMKRIISYAGK